MESKRVQFVQKVRWELVRNAIAMRRTVIYDPAITIISVTTAVLQPRNVRCANAMLLKSSKSLDSDIIHFTIDFKLKY